MSKAAALARAVVTLAGINPPRRGPRRRRCWLDLTIQGPLLLLRPLNLECLVSNLRLKVNQIKYSDINNLKISIAIFCGNLQ
jgi:hypothetical protein